MSFLFLILSLLGTAGGVPFTPPPLLVGDELYLVTDNGIATCVDAKTGQELCRRDWAVIIPLRRLMPTERFTF